MTMLRRRSTRELSRELQTSGNLDVIRGRAERNQALAAAAAAQEAEAYRFPQNKTQEFNTLREKRLKIAQHIFRIFGAQFTSDLESLLTQKIREIGTHLSILNAFIKDECHAQDLAQGRPSKSKVERIFLYILLEIDAWTFLETQLTVINQKIQFELQKGHLDPNDPQLQPLITVVQRRIENILRYLQAEDTYTTPRDRGVLIDIPYFTRELQNEKANVV